MTLLSNKTQMDWDRESYQMLVCTLFLIQTHSRLNSNNCTLESKFHLCKIMLTPEKKKTNTINKNLKVIHLEIQLHKATNILTIIRCRSRNSSKSKSPTTTNSNSKTTNSKISFRSQNKLQGNNKVHQ